jgi:hypothetical protein
VNRFRYWGDGLFIGAVVAYAANRWILKPRLASVFLHGYFNDLLLIPAALPVVLWMQRRLGIRSNDCPPTGQEILLHWIVWSIICEGIGPRISHHGTADPWDVVAYSVGASLAFFWWNRKRAASAPIAR